ncbi:signal peptidase I [Truepera radiovictrix]|uniref:Signal peptidase I n=1 Tax=Truepera radiovictrix (strain DSM 17093 / CIP 108686 / LMG 22925 / RQ-24) TaxID=649638 RepID=D7CW43_TRURR|nr:signal peptidase I [Truepera radiovictrix]ADI14306.1 signal peptidase I [Truepera radiovictrix DSM 17093]WMT57138.1 signal peptidase I [Truepera radiovictrix]
MTTDTHKGDPKAGKRAAKGSGSRFWREVRGYAEALIIAFLIVTFVFTTVGVVGSSMQPTLDGGSGRLPQSLFTGDRVFIPKYDTWLRRMGLLGPYPLGDIVVVREPENAPSLRQGARRAFFIKRVMGRPGDRLRIDNGQVFINGVAVDQSFITDSGEITPDPIDFPVVVVQNGQVVGFQGLVRGTFDPLTGGPAPVGGEAMTFFYGDTIAALAPIPEGAPEGEPFLHELIVPEGHYFVMGDNRQASRGGSEDSRYFGPIDSIAIAGRATAVIWPPRRDGAWNWRRLTPPAAFGAIPDPDGQTDQTERQPEGAATALALTP